MLAVQRRNLRKGRFMAMGLAMAAALLACVPPALDSAIEGVAAVEAAEFGENGYWLTWKGGDCSFTRTSPKLPRPQIVEPR